MIRRHPFISLFLLLLLAVAVNYLDCAPAIVQRGLSLQPLRWFGICSFSLYIWQQPFYKAVTLDGLPRWAGLALALVVGAGAFYGFEHPVRRWLNTAWQHRRAQLRDSTINASDA